LYLNNIKKDKPIGKPFFLATGLTPGKVKKWSRFEDFGLEKCQNYEVQ